MIPAAGIAGLGLRLAMLAGKVGKKAKDARHLAKGAAATVAEKAGPSAKKLAFAPVIGKLNPVDIAGATLVAAGVNKLSKKALTKEGEEKGEVDADSETTETPTEAEHKRSASGAHIVVVKDPESTAYKIASKFGSPDETKEGFRFSLTDDEYSRFKREVA